MSVAADDRPSESRALAPIDQVRGQLDKMQGQFALALPEHVSPEKFVRVVMTAVQGNADLLKASRQSLFGAAMKCAQDGLLPDGREAALVTYGQQVQYLPMIAGVLTKVRRSGELLSIAAHVVYENDAFTYTLGDNEHIDHQPCLTGSRGKAVAVYAVAKTKDGGIYREVMSVEEVNAVRNVSRAKNAGPWVQWWSEMARKTVLRRLSKRLPMSTDLQQVFDRDNDHYDLNAAQGAAKIRRLHADFDEPTPEPGTPMAEGEPAEFTEGEPASDFPGDRPAPEAEDPETWGREEMARVGACETLAALDELEATPGNGDRFRRLQAHSPSISKELEAAARGKRKALEDKERKQ
jgi:recombination protein RecT